MPAGQLSPELISNGEDGNWPPAGRIQISNLSSVGIILATRKPIPLALEAEQVVTGVPESKLRMSCFFSIPASFSQAQLLIKVSVRPQKNQSRFATDGENPTLCQSLGATTHACSRLRDAGGGDRSSERAVISKSMIDRCPTAGQADANPSNMSANFDRINYRVGARPYLTILIRRGAVR